jgi:Tol biopolymer transport system component
MRALLLATVAAGCGRFGFDGAQDASTLSDGDAGVALGAFSAPIRLANVNASAKDDDPTLTGDMLEIYFDSARPGGAGVSGGDVWVARRASTAETFGTPTLVTELASPNDDTTPKISPDGLVLYFASDRAGTGDRDLFVTTRPDRVSPWAAPQRIVELASSSDDNGAMETADRLHLVFASSRGGSEDLFEATRTAVGQPWGNVTKLVNLSTAAVSEDQHWINANATVIYFTADLPGSDGLAIWMATRATPAGDFGAPQRIVELDAPLEDADPWLSSDLRTIVFMSGRGGDEDIYVATR